MTVRAKTARTVRGRPAAVAALALGLAVLSGCEAPAALPTPPAGVPLADAEAADGNGLWLRSGGELASIVSEAVRAAGPVHVTGTVTETVQPDPAAEPVPGRSIAIDFRGTASAFAAVLSAGDATVEIVASPEGTRWRGNAAFVRDRPGGEEGRVVCADGHDTMLADWAPLLDPAELVGALLGAAHAAAPPPAAPGDTLDVVIGEEGAVVGVLTVDRHGAPLPRTFVAADAGGEATLEFTAWGEPVDIDGAAAALTCQEER